MTATPRRSLNVRKNSREVVDHHFDDAQPGKPLYLLIPGGVLALLSLGIMIYVAYQTWFQENMAEGEGLIFMFILAPIYIGAVFIFSYGYELYNLPRALKMTAIIVFITLAAVIIIAVLLAIGGALGKSKKSSSGSSLKSSGGSSRSASFTPSGGGSASPSGFSLPIINLGSGGGTREVIHETTVVKEVPAPPPKPIECPFCRQAYLPRENNFACPSCGAATPKELLDAEEQAGME
jgi:hypothetical protein